MAAVLDFSFPHSVTTVQLMLHCDEFQPNDRASASQVNWVIGLLHSGTGRGVLSEAGASTLQRRTGGN